MTLSYSNNLKEDECLYFLNAIGEERKVQRPRVVTCRSKFSLLRGSTHAVKWFNAKVALGASTGLDIIKKPEKIREKTLYRPAVGAFTTSTMMLNAVDARSSMFHPNCSGRILYGVNTKELLKYNTELLIHSRVATQREPSISSFPNGLK